MKLSREDTFQQEGLLILVGVLFMAIFVGNCLSFWPYINDDAYITFRYSRNLVQGRGPVYNPGEHVEGYTNFLWMIMSSVLLIFINNDSIAMWAKLCGFICSLGSIWLIYQLSLKLYRKAREQGDKQRPIALSFIGVLFLALSPDFACSSVNTLETALFSFLLILGLYRELGSYLEGKPPRFNGILFALAAITRPEGYLYYILALAGLLDIESRLT